MRIKRGLRKHQVQASSDSSAHGDGTWIFSYADMITILMIFFIMMLSISNVSSEKFTALRQALKSDSASADSSGTTAGQGSMNVPQQMRASESDGSATFAGISLAAVAKIAKESAGDRLSQVHTAIRVLLESVNKDYIRREISHAAEFEGLKSEVEVLTHAVAARKNMIKRTSDILIKVSTSQILSDNNQITQEGRKFVASLVQQIRSLNMQPSLRIETHSAAWSAKAGWMTADDTLLKTTGQAGIIARAAMDAGADPGLIKLAAYGSQKPIVNEKDVHGKPRKDVIDDNNRILFVIERRHIESELTDVDNDAGADSNLERSPQ